MTAKKAKGTPLTDRELVVLSAWFARSNSGQAEAPKRDVDRLLAQNPSLRLATNYFCAEFMETEEHEEMFYEEAKAWHKDLSKKYRTREAVLAVWPDVAVYFGWEKNRE